MKKTGKIDLPDKVWKNRIKELKKVLLVYLFLQFATAVSYGQQVGARTNMFWWATTTPNLGVEVAISKKLSLSIDGSYNAWTFFFGRHEFASLVGMAGTAILALQKF
ncbi:MAG: DUF3575 domain-containing protein [Parabacteroides sp.]|nr:DUF3575 domain-containing protein [Parabacteroides sp.]